MYLCMCVCMYVCMYATMCVCMYKCMYVCTYVCKKTMYLCTYVSVFLISSYGAPLAQRDSYLAQHSSLFGPDGVVNYDCIVTNSINSLLIGSKCIPNGTYTNYW